MQKSPIGEMLPVVIKWLLRHGWIDNENNQDRFPVACFPVGFIGDQLVTGGKRFPRKSSV